MPAPVLMLAGGSDSLLTDADVVADVDEALELVLNVAATGVAVAVGVSGAAAVVESSSVCWAMALFVLLFSNLARFNASSRSLASKYQTVIA